MEVQMAAQVAKSAGRSTPPHHHGGGAKAVPGYLRPAAGSCHHVCKYGGTHAFEDKEATKKPHPKPRKQQQPPPAAAPESQSRVMVKVRSVFRRRVGDSSRAAEKASAAASKATGAGDSVEWKDIVAYDTKVPTRGSSPQPDKVSAPVTGSGDAKKKDVTTKGKKSHGKASKITGQVDAAQTTQDETLEKKSTKPPKGKKPMAALLVDKMAIDQELLHGYQTLSPSLMQSRASLLRDLEQEMVRDGAANAKWERTPCSLDEEELAAAAAAETSRPIPAHRRVKSMGIGSSSRSARHPFARQASKNSSGGFKLRSSRSTRAPTLLAEEEKPARLRSRRGEDASSGGTGRGIQLRIRSLRRRGVGGSGGAGASAGFVVPAVVLRHQKTLEKKRSQRLYNNLIEETASKLVKARKSRVKALVGAFESVISKIAK
ncbi:hypothetical protein PAHAL_3G442400 [Panicum hallii]|jgi:hypothetical protein|uniref:Calmodulin-binding domain-containing protein n=1 Tax=Panicum hallii TaxID=206008 RepID=A0A2S3HE17_9POAL|nr:uncharacterized protein LOC112886184 [Panicum hallii]PAN21062.1 hypothetical protein PAHAL_3G442400 [Panicum hallii]